ncbi:MAG: hypothetical protein CMG62_07900 [Candidatus Marinimicrobia bacterium]|nr:hypothetical protein [Candidatus Neomarinimicrobiota bacterium]|tara:strand:+ start:4459 stop:5358 length:900 start_codon:yes stop_codon:yes gene_type:complete
MKKSIILFISFFILISVLIYRPNYKNVNNVPDSELLVIAHRGFGNYAPDNSKSAVKIAISSGMDGVDLDGQMTADGELVIFHDPKVDRLTNGSGPLKEKTLSELRQLDMGYKFDEKYTGETISTYEEILQLVDGRLIVFVELKVSTVESDGSEELAASLIKKYNAYDWAYLSSFNPVVLWRLKKIDPKIKTMFIFKDIDVDPEILKEIHPTDSKGIPWVLRNEFCRNLMRRLIKPDLLSAEITVNKGTVRNLIKKGYPVFLWPPNNKKEIVDSINESPYGIITDEPELTVSLIKESDAK